MIYIFVFHDFHTNIFYELKLNHRVYLLVINNSVIILIIKSLSCDEDPSTVHHYIYISIAHVDDVTYAQ